MTPEEIIEGLKHVKEFEPRPFIIAACDAAIEFVQAHTPAVADVAAAVVDAPAPEVPPADEPVSTGSKKSK